ncbi:MAG TPA: DUF1801 domain-containing protein [Pyrinomonadaceae bacterium]|nr:DUF1801 domain-containing protein [Pyrinomonadaceae bacterium]
MKKATGKKSKVPATADAYLADVEPGARATLEKLRQNIKSIAPKATEVISYGIPTFKLDGKMLASYAAFKEHCSFFPGAVIEEFEDELKSYETSKGTIRFPTNKPLPAALVKKILKARMARLRK